LGNPTFNEDGELVAAEALTLSYFLAAEALTLPYFLESRAYATEGRDLDPINERWELDVFLDVAESVSDDYSSLDADYLSTRSFADELRGDVTGDTFWVYIAYTIAALLFLGGNLGSIRCGSGSRWTMSLGALMTVGLSTVARLGMSSICGLFFSPVHYLLPFILLFLGFNDAFVIVSGCWGGILP
jgi:hypothetical protein